MIQTASRVLMVRPASFGFNEQTAVNNHFQQEQLRGSSVQDTALAEFDEAVERLTEAGIDVFAVPDSPEPPKPDAIFPNNWISTTTDGRIHLYPMFAPNRRAERRRGIVDLLSRQFDVTRVNDWSFLEEQEVYLEGTGSIVFDHPGRCAYAAISPRSSKEALALVAGAYGYEAYSFDAADEQGRPIYHTNVLLSIGEGFAVGCGAAMADGARKDIPARMESAGREWIDISIAEVNAFGANLLQLRSRSGEPVIALSETAYRAFGDETKEALRRHGILLPLSVPTIERVNGGSVRCMLAELFLPVRATPQ